MIFWILWFIIGILTVSLFLYVIFPQIYLKLFATSYPICDRALGKYNIKNGVAILYEPSLSVKKYINRYQVYQVGNLKEKFFIGEWTQKIAHIDYDIIVYDSHNKIIGIYNVIEKFNGNKFTHVTTLPEETDFVSIRLNSVEGVHFQCEKKATWQFWVWLSVFSLCMATAVELLLWFFISFILQCKRGFSGDLTLIGQSWTSIFVLSAICVFVLTGMVFAVKFLRKSEGV